MTDDIRALTARMAEEPGSLAFLDLAEVLQLNGQPPEAEAALRAGLELYERKGDLVSAERARTRLEQVRSA